MLSAVSGTSLREIARSTCTEYLEAATGFTDIVLLVSALTNALDANRAKPIHNGLLLPFRRRRGARMPPPAALPVLTQKDSHTPPAAPAAAGDIGPAVAAW